jgi:hypothetical protein
VTRPARAPAAIAARVLANLGFGLIFWLGAAPPAHPGWVAAVFAALALGLMGASLLLGPRPTLRQALPALAALAAFAAYAAIWIATDRPPALPGWLAAGLAAAAVALGPPGPDRDRAGLAPLARLATASAGGALLAGATVPALWSLGALALVEAAIRLRDPAAARAPVPLAIGLALAALLPLGLLLAFPFKHGLAGLVVLSHVAGAAILAATPGALKGPAVGLRGGSR